MASESVIIVEQYNSITVERMSDMEVNIDVGQLNGIIDDDEFTNTDLGYLLRLIGLVSRHNGLGVSTKRDLCKAMGVCLTNGSRAIRAFEGYGLLYREGGEYRLSEALIVGGDM